MAVTPDLTAIAETARDLAYRQLDQQLQSGDNFDAKLVGLLGFNGVALGVLVAAKDLLHGWWLVTGFGIVLSAFFAAYAIRGVDWKLGPYPKDWYYDVTKKGVGTGAAALANLTLVSEMDAALKANDKVLGRKSNNFLLAISVLVVTAIVTPVLIAFRP